MELRQTALALFSDKVVEAVSLRLVIVEICRFGKIYLALTMPSST